MNSDTELWISFAQTFGVLLVVLAFFLVLFYLFRRITVGQGVKGGKTLISVIAVHHLAPKEKLVLVSVLDELFLLGVSPSGITRLASLDHDPRMVPAPEATAFPELLGKFIKSATNGGPGSSGAQNTGKAGDDGHT